MLRRCRINGKIPTPSSVPLNKQPSMLSGNTGQELVNIIYSRVIITQQKIETAHSIEQVLSPINVRKCCQNKVLNVDRQDSCPKKRH